MTEIAQLQNKDVHLDKTKILTLNRPLYLYLPPLLVVSISTHFSPPPNSNRLLITSTRFATVANLHSQHMLLDDLSDSEFDVPAQSKAPVVLDDSDLDELDELDDFDFSSVVKP